MAPARAIPSFGLYGEGQQFPDLLHVETFADRAAQTDWVIAPHRHPHLHQLFLLREGTARVTAEGQSARLTAGQVISMPAWAVHGFTFSQGAQGYVLSLPTAEFPELFAAPPLAARFQHWQIVPCPAPVDGLFDALHTAFVGQPLGRATLLRALALHLGALLADSLSAPSPDTSPHRSHTLLARFEGLVRQHFRDRWTVADYAAALAVSAPHLSRLCRESLGQPASRFVETVVFKEACNQLAYTRRSVAEIGFALGFEDPAYFSRAFRKHTGMTPRAYRQVLSEP